MTWRSIRLKYVGVVIAGQSPPSECVGDINEGLPFIQGNAEFGPLSPTPRYQCDYAPKRAERGDVLLSVRAPVGALNIAEGSLGIGRGLCAVRASAGLDSSFLRFSLEAAVPALQAEANGSTYDAVSGEDVSNIRVLLPDLPTQAEAVGHLDTETARIDTLIDRKQHFIDLLLEKRTALITRAVTKGLDPSVEMKDSGVDFIGRIPKPWEMAPLYARYEVTLGKMLDAKQITGEQLAPYVRNADVQWDRVNVADLDRMDFDAASRRKFALRPGDLLVCEGGEVGRTAVWRGQLAECYYQKAIHRLRPRDARRDIPRFFYYVMYVSAKAERFTVGSNVATIGHLTATQLRHHRFAFPSASEQETIAAFLDEQAARVDSTVAKTRHSIALLREYRTALISAAVTGQIDIPGTETAERVA